MALLKKDEPIRRTAECPVCYATLGVHWVRDDVCLSFECEWVTCRPCGLNVDILSLRARRVGGLVGY